MATRHSLLDNKVQLYMRPNSPHWQSSCSIAGKQRRTSTKEESLSRAKDVARDWYLGLMGKYRAGELKEGVTFRTAAEHFVKEFEVITEGERNKEYIKSLSISLNVHLLPFIGDRRARQKSEEGALAVGLRGFARLCAVHGQQRPSPR